MPEPGAVKGMWELGGTLLVFTFVLGVNLFFFRIMAISASLSRWREVRKLRYDWGVPSGD